MSQLPLKQASKDRACFNKNSDNENESFEPDLWDKYFDLQDDIGLDVGTFRIYRRGVEGPLLFFLHGGGFSALTWALLSSHITEQVKCQCLAVDMRGHGDTKCENNDDLSIDTLSNDIINIIFAMYPTEAPPIVLVGHSLGGAVAVHVAHKRSIPSLAGLVVIDVVEGSALSSLSGMESFLRSRPEYFSSLSQAIKWSCRTSQIRCLQSAKVSFIGQLKRVATDQTATSEFVQGIACIHDDESDMSILDDKNSQLHLVSETLHETDEVTNGVQKNNVGVQNSDSASLGRTSLQASSTSGCKRRSNKRAEYTWRIDLVKTRKFWQEWFLGLSNLFLSIPEPKLLMLSNTDRLDKELMIGHMQGKFRVMIYPSTGHAVQEDAPEKVADTLAHFLVHNRFTVARSNCER